MSRQAIDLKTLAAGLHIVDVEALIYFAEDRAKAFKADRLKTNQLRNFYSAILQIRQAFEIQQEFTKDIKTMLVLLKPKLAFAAGRQQAVRRNFKPFMDAAIEGVLNAPDTVDKTKDSSETRTGKTIALENYFALIESVVAYHKFYE
ncbi:type III-A CRISPR-associated protein Csm2 [Microscilla marina]|uniref:CRISPR system Cms protein Csm2 n=1 Tax=Microscilla marina ATCC 23134 TaxID=313606 RepID=A1ZV97_MICM2|nr:type III-A CRISPR-associated protein Csm2 [Microscilla marina]EAY25753.1 crispr-associated protein, Csm2 family [Microscilla marina ATCC 23134]